MRPVLFICSVLDTGGAERHWQTLIPALGRHGIPARLVAVKGGGRAFDALADLGVPTRVLGGRGGVRSLAKLPGLRPERDFEPRVVFTWGVDAHFLGAAFARRRRVPHLVHWHAGPGSTITRSQRLALRLVARAGAGAVAVSDSQLDELAGFGFRPERVRVAPSGVPRPHTDFLHREAARAALGLPAEAFVPVLIGRLASEKRIDRFVAAIAELRRRGLTVRGVVVGDGPERDALRERVNEAGAPVDLVGYQDTPGNFMLAADVVCLTSDREGLPLTLLEAAACERPAVVMEIGGVRGAVEDGVTGLVTPRGDLDAFTDALDGLARDAEERSRLGRRAGERWRARFTVDAMIAGYADILGTVTGPPARWPA